MITLQVLALLALSCSFYVSASKKNVLLIVVDDFRPEINDAYMNTDEALYKDIITPRMSALADDSMVFTQAYSQYPSCGPSRASFLTGRRPDTTQVFKNEDDFREKLGKHIVTLPQYFKTNGYKVYGAGKVFHNGMDDSEYSWSEEFFDAKEWIPFWQTKTFNKSSWGEADVNISLKKPLSDQQTFQYINDKLHNIGTENFFMVAGFKKPHLPFICPKSYFDKYPIEKIKLPANPYVPKGFPRIGWNDWMDLFNFTDMKAYDKSYNHTTNHTDTLNLRRAYYACTSYIDDLVGKLLDTLQEKQLDSNTVVSLVSDHGFHLGEHSTWTKGTLFSLDLHIPMMIKVPGVTDKGRKLKTDKFVELIDLFPTLAEAAGLDSVPECKAPKDENLCAEGASAYRFIKNLKNNPKKGKQYVLAQYRKRNEMGYSIKTKDYHYICWLAIRSDVPQWDKSVAEELYDVKRDPNENYNIASDNTGITSELKEKLKKAVLGDDQLEVVSKSNSKAGRKERRKGKKGKNKAKRV